MELSSRDIFLLSQCARASAHAAGELIAEHADKKLQVLHKDVGDSEASQVVTELDHLSQKLILKNLEQTCQEFDLGLLAEESTDDGSRLSHDYFWCIDPLDGTLPFIEGHPGYSVSIALVARDGTPQLGVVYDPREEMLYHAIRGQGAFRDGDPWKLKPEGNPKDHQLTLMLDRSFQQFAHDPAIEDRIRIMADRLGYKGLSIRSQGAAVMNAIWALEESPACYLKLPKPERGGGSFWDFAATACLFQEIGASVSDVTGQPLKLNRAESTFMNESGVLYASGLDLAISLQEVVRDFSSSL